MKADKEIEKVVNNLIQKIEQINELNQVLEDKIAKKDSINFNVSTIEYLICEDTKSNLVKKNKNLSNVIDYLNSKKKTYNNDLTIQDDHLPISQIENEKNVISKSDNDYNNYYENISLVLPFSKNFNEKEKKQDELNEIFDKMNSTEIKITSKIKKSKASLIDQNEVGSARDGDDGLDENKILTIQRFNASKEMEDKISDRKNYNSTEVANLDYVPFRILSNGLEQLKILKFGKKNIKVGLSKFQKVKRLHKKFIV